MKTITTLTSRLKNPLHFFIIISGLFGIFCLLVVPPFQAPDEEVHFYRSYQISRFNIVPDYTNAGFGGMLPRELPETEMITSANPRLLGNDKIKYNIHKTHLALQVKKGQPPVAVNFVSTVYYSPVSYIPQVVGVWIGRIVQTPPIVWLYAARLFGLAAWMALTAAAIRIMPRRKWALVAVALLPPMVAQAAAVSADPMTTGTIALFAASILYFRERSRALKWREWVFLGAIAVIMSLSKQMSFVLLPLLLLVPNGFKANKNALLSYFKRAMIAVPAIVLAAAWYLAIHRLNIGLSGGSAKGSSEQIAYISSQPFEYVLTTLRTYFMGYGDSIYTSLTGSFGWDVTVSFGAIVLCYLLLAFALVFHEKDDTLRPLNRLEKTIVATTGLAYVMGVSTALYVGFTKYKQKYISGIQGRYMYPLLFMIGPFVSSARVKLSGVNYTRVLRVGYFVLLSFCGLMIYLRYYVHTV